MTFKDVNLKLKLKNNLNLIIRCSKIYEQKHINYNIKTICLTGKRLIFSI